MPDLVLPDEAWKKATPRITCSPSCRTPGHYLECVVQFSLKAKRYSAADGHTDCKTFVEDVLAAMGVVWPHWVEELGKPAPMSPDAYELNVNSGIQWLDKHAAEYGIREVSESEARTEASLGRPTWVTYREEPHGHTAIVLPSPSQTRIAQAGKTNFFDRPLSSGFGTKGPLRFWTHE